MPRAMQSHILLCKLQPLIIHILNMYFDHITLLFKQICRDVNSVARFLFVVCLLTDWFLPHLWVQSGHVACLSIRWYKESLPLSLRVLSGQLVVSGPYRHLLASEVEDGGNRPREWAVLAHFPHCMTIDKLNKSTFTSQTHASKISTKCEVGSLLL